MQEFFKQIDIAHNKVKEQSQPGIVPQKPTRKDYKPPQSAPPLKYRQRERAKVEAKIVLCKVYLDIFSLEKKETDLTEEEAIRLVVIYHQTH